MTNQAKTQRGFTCYGCGISYTPEAPVYLVALQGCPTEFCWNCEGQEVSPPTKVKIKSKTGR